MKKVFLFMLLLVSVFSISHEVFAAVREVPLVYPNIQAAVNAASSGDIVRVNDGTFTGIGNKNIVFGDKSITVESVNGPEFTTIDVGGGLDDGFSLNGFSHGTWEIRGFTITNASKAINYEYQLYSTLIIRNCILTGNSVGIHCYDASPTIDNCIIDNNFQGLRLRQYVSQYNCSPKITNCRISNNSGYSRGGGVSCTAAYDDKCKPEFTNCIITGNGCQGDFGEGGGGLYFDNCTPTLTSCIVSNNTVADGEGGGIFLERSPAKIYFCKFFSNTADRNGGAIYCNNSSPSIRGSLFWNNRCRYSGGGVYCTDNSSPSIINCTFHYNPGGNDANTIYAWRMNSNPIISNSIIWSTQSYHRGIDHGSSVTPVVTYSNVVRGFPGTGNVEVDPLFVDVKDPDPANWDLHLQFESPCIDAGSNALVPGDLTNDMDGNGRILDGDWVGGVTVDMGADEFASIRVPQQYPTIQAAVNAAPTGYRVMVATGWYDGPGNRNIDFQGKAITVRSVNGPDSCVIDCQNAGRGFVFQNGETRLSILKGLTIRNAYTNYGGGVWCSSGASPKIENCKFEYNTATIRGGGVYAHSASPKISGCRFFGNTANDRGGAIWSYNSFPVITGSTMVKNTANYGGAFSFQNSSPIMAGSVIYGNTANIRGGSD